MEARGLYLPKWHQEIRGNALLTSQIKDFDRKCLGKNKRNRAHVTTLKSYWNFMLSENYRAFSLYVQHLNS